MNKFFEISKEIANEFLQNIVFIDDKAFINNEEKNSHEFDALQITRAFAKSKKICAVYKPETSEDINNLAQLAKKADVSVIDWQLHLDEKIAQDNGEEDAENDDPRGPHTRKIIREILSDPITGKGSLKLILIYTGELGLQDIANDIFSDLNEQCIPNVQRNDCIIFTDNIKIMVVAKPSDAGQEGGSKFKYNPELNNKIVEYSELPDFILTRFTEMTDGLLSNFVLQSLSILRKNTFRLIKLYSKELDPSFLSHRLLLTNQDDSKEHLIEFLSHSIQALLNYNEVGKSVSLEKIHSWIDQYAFSKSISVSSREISLDNAFLKTLFANGISKSIKDHWSKNNYGDPGKNIDDKFKEKIHKKGSSFLMEADDSSKQDSEFSILTHHKSNLKQPSSTPKLSLGTIVKQDNNLKYFVCIQAKCDSVRINDERKFLFLPLIPSDDDKFQFLVEENGEFVKLKSVKEVYLLRTMKFIPKQDNDLIIAEQGSDGIFYFMSSYDEKLIWICDLKEAHAQRIANIYAGQLSRIGLDESEWLRRWSGQRN